MKLFPIFLLIIISFQDLKAQDNLKKNTIVIEMGGAGMTFSANYEYLIIVKSNHKIMGKAGLGYFPLYENNKAVFGTINKILGLSYLYSLGNNHFETGISNCFATTFNKSITNDEFSKTTYILSPSIGYRFQDFSKKSILFYVGYTPLISFDGIGIEPQTVFFKNYFSLGIGYGF